MNINYWQANYEYDSNELHSFISFISPNRFRSFAIEIEMLLGIINQWRSTEKIENHNFTENICNTISLCCYFCMAFYCVVIACSAIDFRIDYWLAFSSSVEQTSAKTHFFHGFLTFSAHFISRRCDSD